MVYTIYIYIYRIRSFNHIGNKIGNKNDQQTNRNTDRQKATSRC